MRRGGSWALNATSNETESYLMMMRAPGERQFKPSLCHSIKCGTLEFNSIREPDGKCESERDGALVVTKIVNFAHLGLA